MGFWRRQAEGPEGPGTGDTAFEAEALAHLDSLFGTALRLTRDRAAAEDLVQDTYLKALRFAGRFERGTNLRAWLFTILHNTFRNDRRGAGRNPVQADSETVERAATMVGGEAGPEAALLQAALSEDLQAALDALPEAFRQAVWLRDVEDFSYADIAAMLEIPPGTVMSRIARGRRLLLQQLSRTRGGGSAAGRQ